MRRELRLKNSFSFEELGQEPNIVDAISEPIVTSTNVSQLIEQTDADVIVGEDLSEDIYSASEDLELLSNIAETVDDKIKTGEGLSETSAILLQQTLESIYIRRGISRRHIPPFIAVENFKNTRTRLLSSKIALESILDLVKTIGKYVSTKIHSLAKWFKRAWENFRNLFLSFYSILSDIKKKISSLSSISNSGKFDKIKWLNKVVYCNQASSKWDIVSTSLKNVMRATDLERKAWKQIEEYLGNPSKNLSSLVEQDPFKLGSFKIYLGSGRFVRRDDFTFKDSIIESIAIPSIPQLTELVDECMSLVSPSAVKQYESIENTIYRYAASVEETSEEFQIEYGKRSKTRTTTTVSTKMEYQVAIDLARELIGTFWRMRKSACRATIRLSNHFIDKYGK